MTRTLATGASGFIGRHVVERLLAAGEEVVTLSRSAGEAQQEHHGRWRHVAADVRDTEKVAGAMQGIERVIHLAAAVATRSPALSESINVGGTRVLAQAAADSLDQLGIPRRQPLRHVQVPRWVGWMVGGWGEIMTRGLGRRVFLNLDKIREGVGGSWICDGSRAAQELSFRPPVDLATRLLETTTDYQQSNWI